MMSGSPPSDFKLLAEDILRQPELLADKGSYLRQAARGAVRGLATPERVFLVSSGDGLSASFSARYIWERALSCPVEALPSMTFSRYGVESAGPGSLVIILSSSGKVIRAIEALSAAKRCGLPTLVLTNHPESPIGQLAGGRVFDLAFPRLGFVPGMSAYSYTLAALYELVAALIDSGSLAEAIRGQVDHLPEALSTALQSSRDPAWEFAQRLQKGHPTYALGSGPLYGAAHYTTRKLFEVCQLDAVLLETEEYAHDAFYAMGERTPTILFAPPDAGFERCAEVAGYLARIGCPLAVVSGQERRSEFSPGSLSFAGLPSGSWVESTVTYPLVAQLLACFAGERLGSSFYASADAYRYELGDAQIYASQRMDRERGSGA